MPSSGVIISVWQVLNQIFKSQLGYASGGFDLISAAVLSAESEMTSIPFDSFLSRLSASLAAFFRSTIDQKWNFAQIDFIAPSHKLVLVVAASPSIVGLTWTIADKELPCCPTDHDFYIVVSLWKKDAPPSETKHVFFIACPGTKREESGVSFARDHYTRFSLGGNRSSFSSIILLSRSLCARSSARSQPSRLRDIWAHVVRHLTLHPVEKEQSVRHFHHLHGGKHTDAIVLAPVTSVLTCLMSCILIDHCW